MNGFPIAPLAALTAALALTGGALAVTFDQPFGCSLQASGDSSDCAAAGLGANVNGCLKVDGLFVNSSAKPVEGMFVTVTVAGKLVTSIPAKTLAGPVPPGQRGPFSGSAKYEFNKAVALTSALYAGPAVECLISVK